VNDHVHHHAHAHAPRRELWREATTMVLYVSIVLLAELAVLPARISGNEAGLSSRELLGIIWGTTIGLALAHWFAFRLAATAFGAGGTGRADVEVAAAQLSGAALVALIASLPILVLPDDLEHRAVPVTLSVEVGFIGYVVARMAGQRRWPAFLFGLTALLLGLAIALVKILLDH
jgi:hypothetical protein